MSRKKKNEVSLSFWQMAMGNAKTAYTGRFLAFTLTLAFFQVGRAADCNRNGSDDTDDIATGVSLDCNLNGVPDECDLLPPSLFALPESFAAGARAPSVFAGDLDGDGDLDLAAADDRMDQVAVLRNSGNRNFRDPLPYGAGNGAKAITGGDFDGDDDIDLVTANYFGQDLSVFLNRGNGTLLPAVSYPAGPEPWSLVVVDVNRDGNLDIVASHYNASTLSVILNRGGAQFDPPVDYSTGAPVVSSASFVAASDLDGDGFDDLIGLGAESEELFLLFNGGDGTFGAAMTINVGRLALSATAADLDGDADLDLVLPTVTDAAGISVLRNLGGRTFAEPERSPLEFLGSYITSADLDGDGDMDLAVGRAYAFMPGITVLLNDGNANFAEPENFFAGPGPSSIQAADLDGDGDSDLFTANNTSGTVSVLWNVRSSLYRNGREARVGNDPYALTAADVDGDFDLDIAALNSADGNLMVLLNDGHGGLSSSAPYNLSSGQVIRAPRSVAAADLEGDSDQDLAIAVGGSSQIVVMLNQGGGSYAPATFFRTDYPPDFVAAADFDLDGDRDLMEVSSRGCCPGGRIAIYRNRGLAEFDDQHPVEIDMAGELFEAVAADLDGDGVLEIATANSTSNDVTILFDSGGLQFTVGLTLPAGVAPWSITAADLEGDANLDLAVANHGSAELSVYRNGGGGSFADPVFYPVGRGPRAVRAGDADGDGDLDLAVTNIDSDSVTVLVNDGTGRFSRAANLATGETPWGLVLADFDRDGKADIATANVDGRTISLILSRPLGGTSEDCNRNGIPDECDILTAGADQDGNGIPDSCESQPFHRGDPNGDGGTDISDGIFVLGFLFLGGQAPGCRESADSDNDGVVLLTDAVVLFQYLFLHGDPPPEPGPATSPCGLDTDSAGSARYLGCERYETCSGDLP